MYTLSIGENILYDPRISEYNIISPELRQEVHKISTMSFEIYPFHPQYNNISKMVGNIKLYLDDEMISIFRPMYSKEQLNGGIKYQCEEMLARLNDIKCRPKYFEGTIEEYLEEIISDFNTLNIDQDIVFYAGNVVGFDNDEHKFINEDYIGFWDLLVRSLPDEYEGYLVPRYESNGIYIDYLTEENLPTASQKIEFGKNLVSKFVEQDASSVYTVLIPLGEEVERDDPEEGQSATTPLTIAEVNDGKDYLEDSAGIAIYGRREFVESFDGIEDANALKTAGQEWLQKQSAQMVDSTSLTAVDLRNTSASIEAFRFMQRVNAISSQYGLSAWYPITQSKIPLGEPKNTKIVVGVTKGGLTEKVNSKASSETVSKVAQRLVQTQQETKNNTKEIDLTWRKAGLSELGDAETLMTRIQANAEGVAASVTQTVYNAKMAEIDTTVSGLRVDVDGVTAEVVSARDGQTTLSTKLSVMDGAIDARVEKGSVISSINQTAEAITIQASKVNLSGYVSVDFLSGTTQASYIKSTKMLAGELSIANTGGFTLSGYTASWQQATVEATGGQTITLYYVGR